MKAIILTGTGFLGFFFLWFCFVLQQKRTDYHQPMEEPCGAGSGGHRHLKLPAVLSAEQWTALTIRSAVRGKARGKERAVLPAGEACLASGCRVLTPWDSVTETCLTACMAFSPQSILFTSAVAPSLQVNRDTLIKRDLPGAQS